MSFEDHFSQHAQDYARHRPRYSSDLFAYLASVSPGRRLVWDCGTGNGQAALELGKYFDRVVATDASFQQIGQAFRHSRVHYLIQQAEEAALKGAAVELVTVAVAVHWFDLDRFYDEVRRVLKPGGVLAVWTYHLPVIEASIDRVLAFYYADVLAGYWPPRIKYLDEKYRTLPFPFDEIEPPEFQMEAIWDLDQLIGLLGSWSASRKYAEFKGRDPVDEIRKDLFSAWGDPKQKRLIRWPLHIRIGRTASVAGQDRAARTESIEVAI